MKQTILKKVIGLGLVIAVLLSMMAVPAFAAFSIPNISENNYILAYCSGAHDLKNKRVWVWKDSNLTTRNPAEWIDVVADQIQVLAFYSNGVIKVKYPVKNGYKVRYTHAGAVFPSLTQTEVVTATSRIQTYKLSNLAQSYGYIDSGDQVFIYGDINGNSKYRVVYPIPGGYKAAFISASDYQKLKNQSPTPTPLPNTETEKITARLNEMMSGTYGNNTYKLWTKYTGPYSSEQCKGFAKQIHKTLFGYNIGSTKSKPYNYQISINGTNTSTVGSLTNLSDTNLRNLFAKGRPGDFIQVRRSHTGSHSMIFLSADNNSVTVYESNLDGKNTIAKNTYSWSKFRSSNIGVSLYTANNYYLH